jgi:mRNA-degrading endonuclease YafQ of YafQ-DinJ toxin-antitoxin module
MLTTKRFKETSGRARNLGEDLEKLWSVVAHLMAGQRLAPRHRAQRLSGDRYRSWERHVEPDWLLDLAPD